MGLSGRIRDSLTAPGPEIRFHRVHTEGADREPLGEHGLHQGARPDAGGLERRQLAALLVDQQAEHVRDQRESGDDGQHDQRDAGGQHERPLAQDGLELFTVVQEPEPTPTATPTPTDTSEPGAITPTTPTESADDQSGFGVAAAVVSLLAVVLVLARRVRS